MSTLVAAVSPMVDRVIGFPAALRVSLRGFFGVAGPGALIAVGYIDPGNWATDLAGGSGHGYTLLSVILIANLLAMVLQALAVRLGVATGRDLAQLSAERFGRKTRTLLWISAEVAMVATDLAELIGSAVALNLLFGLPLAWGVVATAADVLVLMVLPNQGGRLAGKFLIRLVTLLVAGIAVAFGTLLTMASPDWGAVAAGFVPSSAVLKSPEQLVIALGILGATVMPHNLYLHSRLAAEQAGALDDGTKAHAIRLGTVDSTISLTLALMINAAILIAAAAIFHARGAGQVTDLADAARLIDPVLGTSLAGIIFALALLAAGQSATITGTLAGQIVMDGFMNWRVSPIVRRLITRLAALGPALAYVIATGGEDTAGLLVISQVALTLQLPFAMAPLVWFASDKQLMGRFAIGGLHRGFAWAATAVVIGLGLLMLSEQIA